MKKKTKRLGFRPVTLAEIRRVARLVWPKAYVDEFQTFLTQHWGITVYDAGYDALLTAKQRSEGYDIVARAKHSDRRVARRMALAACREAASAGGQLAVKQKIS